MSKKITIVIKIGGSSLESYEKIVKEISLLIKSGKQVIIVHGGGKLISSWSKKMNKEVKFINGLRYTDDEALEIATGILAGVVNKKIVASFLKNNINAIGQSGVDANLLIGKRIGKELGNVGEIFKVNKSHINFLLTNNLIPVIAPIVTDIKNKNELLNVNADNAAIAIAIAIAAEKCILLSDIDGVLDQNGVIINELTIKDANRLINEKIISEGMIPKVKNCIKAAKLGVTCHIANSNRSSILKDIFKEKAIQTIIK
jgi:acetylglutamate kinase